MRLIQVIILLLAGILYAQENNQNPMLHLREIPKHNLAIDLGIVEPLGDYNNIARTGLSAALIYDFYFNKNIGLSLAGRHTYNETAFETLGNGNPQNEVMNSITAGVIGSKTFNRFQMDAFARLGIGFLSNNDGLFLSRNDDEAYFSTTNTSKDTNLVLDAGLRFNYYFRRTVQVYFSPQLHTTIGDAYKFEPLPLSSTSSSTLRTNNSSIGFSNIILALGVKFSIGREYTSGELRDDGESDN
jgi:hypothetical protein